MQEVLLRIRYLQEDYQKALKKLTRFFCFEYGPI